MTKLKKKTSKNYKIQVNGGFQTRDFVFVGDVVKIIEASVEKVLNNLLCEQINVLTGNSISIEDLSSLLMKIIGKFPKKTYVNLISSLSIKVLNFSH